ncbi:dienelactone hydrolase family protein [Alteromonas sp. 5E99-2]|uniref:alpha/beta family hydrolase n=1 Tax=Alteromonas sp. 5E99-2 TaxID=2817683 RepID=UPI001A994BE1|nr:alpha/beta family hydrolase [Alteromonas sp. 5E99-2]MBO1254867.1 dienelactone hydrolase family protein [Alteromonas sp. 5E99-2]
MKPVAHLLLTHGAGAPVESDFIVTLSLLLAKQGIKVTTFNFAYMEKQVLLNKKHPPSRIERLVDEFKQQVLNLKYDLPVFVAGKSMGGRVATMLMTDMVLREKVKGVIVYGYPFHPPRKADKTRLSHLPDVCVPIQILQGERDTFGNKTEVEGYGLPANVSVSFVNDGDHSFKPRKKSGFNLNDNMEAAAVESTRFIMKTLSLASSQK